MKTQIMLYRISYFIFCIFISCLIVFTIHKGFQKQDIITIPIFGILLFLIIDFSAKSMYQNKLENFLNNSFSSQLTEQFTQEEESSKNKIYKFRTAKEGYGMSEGQLVNSGIEKNISEKDLISKEQCPPKNGNKGFWVCNQSIDKNEKKSSSCGCVYDVKKNDPLNLFNKTTEEESSKNKIYKFRTAKEGYGMSEGQLVNSGIEKNISEKDLISKKQCPPKNGIKGFWVCNQSIDKNGMKSSSCGCVYDVKKNDPLNLFNKKTEEESSKNKIYKFRTAKEGYGMSEGQLVNSGIEKNISEKDLISKEQCPPKNGNKGFWVCNQSIDKNGMKSSSCGCVYDVKKNDQLNLFNKTTEEEMYQKYASVESDQNKSQKQDDSKKSMTPSGDKKAKKAMSNQEERPDINKHLMDDGNNGLKNNNSDTSNPVNINVSYNNNRPYTINDFNNDNDDKNTEKPNKIPDINKYRFDDGNVKPPVKSNVQKSDTDNSGNYEMKMMRKILNEQNDPSPVLLESGYSEWKPLDN